MPRDDAPASERKGPIPPASFQAPTASASTGQNGIPAMRWDGFEAYLLDQVKAAVTAADQQGRITHWNRHAQVLFGWEANEAMGRDFEALLMGPEDSSAPRGFRAALRGETSWEGEVSITGKGGGQLLCYWSLSPIRGADGTPSGVVGICVDVTERARKDRLVAARTAVTRALAEAADLAAAAPPILRAVCRHLGWEVGALWRVDEPAGVLRCMDVWQQASREALAFEELTRRITFPPGVGLPGRVWKSDGPAWIPDVAQDDNFPRASVAATEGVHGAFGFPIRRGTTVLGVLEFFSREIREPDDLLLSTMSVIGSQIGQFIERIEAEAARRRAEEELMEQQERLRLALEAGKMGTWQWEVDSGRVIWDETIEAIFGVPAGGFSGSYQAYLELLHPDDREWMAETIRQSAETGSSHHVEHRVIWPDGTVRWVEGTGRALRDERGRITGMIGIAADITERKREEDIQRFLAEATALLAESLDYETTLQRVARLAVSPLGSTRLADWCAVHIREDSGRIRALAVEHIDPSKIERAVELGEYPTDLTATQGVPEVIRTGRSEIYPVITDEMLAAAVPNERILALLRELGIRSAMMVPLSVGGRTLGAISFATAESGRRYEPQDLAIAEDLAARAALAVENARLFSTRTEMAQKLQEGFLPPELPDIPGVELAGRYQWGGGGEVGGDFFDAFPTGDRAWAVAIGDVCGKGPEAAVVTALARYTIRAVAMAETKPSRVLESLNDAVRQQRSDRTFCTVCYARLRMRGDGVRMTVCCAGHPLPMVLRADGAVQTAGAPGTLLGIFEEPELTDRPVDLGPGDALILFTDGVIEERAPGAVFDRERLESVVRASQGLDAEGIAGAIQQAILSFRPDPPRDDIAILVVRVSPADA